MKFQVVYCNHQTAELAVREKLAFSSPEQLGQAYETLREEFPHAEHVVISTCNRIELYSAQENSKPIPSQNEIASFLAHFHRVPRDSFADNLLEHSGPDAVKHLFRVASSLDSMVLGEPQIVRQVKEAYDFAGQSDACGPLTNALFQGALRVSSRVRTETKLVEGRVSIASVAVGDFGKSIFNRFDDKTVVVIGAGEMAGETLRYLKKEGAKTIIVVNRNKESGEELAGEFCGVYHPFSELDHWLSEADIVVSTTGSLQPIIDVERFAAARLAHKKKPVFILDLGAPRDFESAVGNLDENVFLYDIDDLKTICERNRKTRKGEIEKAERIVEEETLQFMHGIYHRATGPVIKRLREEWHSIRQREVDDLFSKLPHLESKDREHIERTVERIVNKLLHPPLEALRDESESGTPHLLLNALKKLFRLNEPND